MKIRKYFFIEMLSLPISSLKLGKNKMAAPIIFRPDKASQLLITTQFCGYLALMCLQGTEAQWSKMGEKYLVFFTSILLQRLNSNVFWNKNFDSLFECSIRNKLRKTFFYFVSALLREVQFCSIRFPQGNLSLRKKQKTYT